MLTGFEAARGAQLEATAEFGGPLSPGTTGHQQLDEIGPRQRPTLAAALDPAPNQQQEHQQADGVEVDLAALAGDRRHHSGDKAPEHAEGDGQIDVQPTHAQPGPGGPVKGQRAIGDGREREQQRGDGKELTPVGLHARHAAGVEGKAGEHDVAGARSGDADADQLAASLASARALGLGIEGVDLVAGAVEEGCDRGQGDLLGVPLEVQALRAEVDPGLADAGQHRRKALDQPHAGGTVQPDDVEVGAARARAEVGLDLWVVEVGVGWLFAGLRRGSDPLGVLEALAQRVEVGQPGLVDQLVDRPTAATAKAGRAGLGRQGGRKSTVGAGRGGHVVGRRQSTARLSRPDAA